MFPVAWFHNLNYFLPPYLMTACVLMGGCGCVFYFSKKIKDRRLLEILPALIFILAGMLYLLSTNDFLQKSLSTCLLVIAVLALGVHIYFQHAPHDDACISALKRTVLSPITELERQKHRASRISEFYLAICIFVSTFLLFHQLGCYVKPFLAWESNVFMGFQSSSQNGEGIWSHLGKTLLWDDGLISSGDKSLFYGAPTYALVHFTGLFLWAIRFVPVLTAMLSIFIIFLTGRRFFGPVVGGAAAILLATNVNFFFHARYGTSTSATTLTLLCALYCVWQIFLSDRPEWWHGALAGGALSLATFHYAPGRLVVLTLAGMSIFWAGLRWRQIRWQQTMAVILMASVLIGLWCWQKRKGHAEAFLRGGEENYFRILQNADNLKRFLGHDVDSSRITASEKIELALRLLKPTVPQYLWFLTPRCEILPPGEAIRNCDYALPTIPLYYGPMALFILLGMAYSLRRINDIRHLSLLAWMLLCTFPLLLTTNVDAHRTMIFVVPLTIWAALGTSEAVKVMRLAEVPSWLQHVLAILVAFTLLQNVIQYCFLS